jgi:hypothetical protein
MRHLFWFFVLGATLLAGKVALERVWSRVESAPLVVHVRADASSVDRERAIDEAVLVEEAWRAGGARIDPVVREQLLTSMRATKSEDGVEDDAALLERALALGLHRADPVTRQRLAFQAEQLLTARVATERPGEAVLDAYLRAHRARYALPARVSFVQVFVSSGRHGAELASDASTLLSELRRARVPAEAAASFGDPSLFPRRFAAVDAVALDAQLGPGFARALWRSPLGQWAGPIPSAYGLHLVWLEEHSDGRVPALFELRERVLADYRHDRRRELLRERLRALRSSYRVELRSPRS